MSKARVWIIEALGSKCAVCGEADFGVLHIDHKYGQGYIENEFFQDKEEMYKFYVQEWDKEGNYLQILCMNCNLKKRMVNEETAGRPKLKELERFFLSDGKDPFKLSPDELDESIRKSKEKEAELEQFLKINPQFVPLHKRIKKLIDYSNEFVNDYHVNVLWTADAINWLPKPYKEIMERQVRQFSGLYDDVILRRSPKFRKVHPEDARASVLNEDKS